MTVGFCFVTVGFCTQVGSMMFSVFYHLVDFLKRFIVCNVSVSEMTARARLMTTATIATVVSLAQKFFGALDSVPGQIKERRRQQEQQNHQQAAGVGDALSVAY